MIEKMPLGNYSNAQVEKVITGCIENIKTQRQLSVV